MSMMCSLTAVTQFYGDRGGRESFTLIYTPDKLLDIIDVHSLRECKHAQNT